MSLSSRSNFEKYKDNKYETEILIEEDFCDLEINNDFIYIVSDILEEIISYKEIKNNKNKGKIIYKFF